MDDGNAPCTVVSTQQMRAKQVLSVRFLQWVDLLFSDGYAASGFRHRDTGDT